MRIGRSLKNSGILLLIVITISCIDQKEEKEYYASGVLKSHYSLKNGKIEGIGYKYFETGDIQQESHWKEGVKNGKTITFYKNGKKEIVSEFIDGMQDGETLFYDSLGVLRGKQLYSKNILSGPFEMYYASGALHLEGSYSDSGRTSIAYEYYVSGEQKSYIYSRDDTLVYQKDYDKNGGIKSCYFTLNLDYDGNNICFQTAHSLIKKDSLGVEINVETGLVTTSNSKVYSVGDSVCLSKERVKDQFSGYFCEVLLTDTTYQGCIFFDVKLDEFEIGKIYSLSSTLIYDGTQD